MIKNLLFDLGGVIMDLKREHCVEAYKALGLENADEVFGLYGQTGVFYGIESGQITTEEFHEGVRALIKRPVTDAQIDDAFMQFLVGIPVERLVALRHLRGEYRLYLLSNTNEIMMNAKIAEEFRKEGYDIEKYFDGVFTSYEAKVCKPDRRIFDYAASRGGFLPEETLFFDDSPGNVEAARSYGYHAVLVEPGAEFYNLLPTPSVKEI